VGSSLLKPPGGSPVGGPWNSSGAPDQVGEGRRSVARNIDRSLLRSLLAATIVILALTFLGILVSVYPTELFSTQSADKPIIPVWESGGEEQAAQKAEDADIPTPTLSSAPTQIETSGATEETAIDGWAREVVEAALREPVAQGPKQADEAAKGGDDLPRAAFENPAARPADPVVPRVESAPSENTLTSSQDPALTSTAQYPDTDVTAQPLPPQTSPPDTPADTEAFPQPSAPPDETTPSS
jgi:hypothetical protein